MKNFKSDIRKILYGDIDDSSMQALIQKYKYRQNKLKGFQSLIGTINTS